MLKLSKLTIPIPNTLQLSVKGVEKLLLNQGTDPNIFTVINVWTVQKYKENGKKKPNEFKDMSVDEFLKGLRW